ncbi:hypothetical protein RIF29_05382 [Crotalaria pallida]|uniref:FMN hydroxy acid dehydrogenase domain-containing protein n=1 Tax=Crotalaria pallida TaxID=3830 RepID=A0AAN9J2S2_CROPI
MENRRSPSSSPVRVCCSPVRFRREPVNVSEFQQLAREVLPKMYYDFYAGRAEDEFSLKENVEAFSRITLRPRVLMDVSRIDMSTTVLGCNIFSPIMIAPTAMHKLAHPEGEVATAKVAACNTIMVFIKRKPPFIGLS